MTIAVYLIYGFIFGVILMKFLNEKTKTGTVYGECPYCRQEGQPIKYYEVWECTACEKQFTDKEAYAQHAANEEADEHEQQYLFQKQIQEQRTEEYKEKLNDLNSEYGDLRRDGRIV